MSTFHAEIRAPQGGPVFVHYVEGNTVAECFRRIAEDFDFDAAESVTVRVLPGYRADFESASSVRGGGPDG